MYTQSAYNAWCAQILIMATQVLFIPLRCSSCKSIEQQQWWHCYKHIYYCIWESISYLIAVSPSLTTWVKRWGGGSLMSPFCLQNLNFVTNNKPLFFCLHCTGSMLHVRGAPSQSTFLNINSNLTPTLTSVA